MEARIAGDGAAQDSHHNFYGMISSTGLQGLEKRSLEWDPNEWRWDGHLFIASPSSNHPFHHQTASSSRQFFPLEAGVSTNSSSSCSDEANPVTGNGKRELEKRRRLLVVNDDDLEGHEESGILSLKLGGNVFPRMNDREVSYTDGMSKKTKFIRTSSTNRAVCQVEHCGADLSSAKDYHRRHKVCEMHSKASSALVANVLQRFCQQCSRFHVLHEFDQGKRSCRRRLAGHNKRRRKSQPDAVVNHNSMTEGQASSYLLISLLRILSNMHSNGSNQTSDQDLLSHLLSSLVNKSGLHVDKLKSGFLQDSHNLLNSGTSLPNSDAVAALLSNGFQGPPQPSQQDLRIITSEMPQRGSCADDVKAQDIQSAAFQNGSTMLPMKGSHPPDSDATNVSAGRSRLNAFDLNDVYIDSDDCTEDFERSPATLDLAIASLECPSYVRQDSHQSSPLQTSRNSDSAYAQSPSSSSVEAQGRTDRIIIKLFGKEPSDFPLVLRPQILDWLSQSPSDIEGYIRPGCVVLTIYLRQSASAWEELCSDLTSGLSRLLNAFEDYTFWTTGWIYVRMQNQIAFALDGRVVAETSLPSNNDNYTSILSVTPIAVPLSVRARFLVKGYNLKRSYTGLLCAFEGNYLVEEEASDELEEGNNIQCRRFSCSIPVVAGRGYIEVEDHGLSSSFFPFIVAEKDVCDEICTLERAFELTNTIDAIEMANAGKEARNQALDFIHEMGWLLHRNHLKSRLGGFSDPTTDSGGAFPFRRLKWLVEFCMDRDWCAVLRKLLNILLDGTVSVGELKVAMSEMGLLHRAIHKNSRPLVEFLLRYVPDKVSDELRTQLNSLVAAEGNFLFRPDEEGPAGLTPLHVAAGTDGSADVLDALTDDPGEVGVKAWKSAHDGSGFTPEDYARLRGHYSHIHLVQRKINRRSGNGHVVVNIPGHFSDSSHVSKKQLSVASFGIGGSSHRKECGVCEQKLAAAGGRGYYSKSSLVYRPAMLSMVAIAAVCVCVALLFKSCPEVVYVFHPFRWEMLDFGSS